MIELMNIHLSDLKVLYKLVLDKNKKAETDEKEREEIEKQQAAEAMEDELEDML